MEKEQAREEKNRKAAERDRERHSQLLGGLRQ